MEKKRKYWGNNETEPVEALVVPSAELDDEDEKVVSEDEENNYYSIGGEGV